MSNVNKEGVREKHITVLEPYHDKLKWIAKEQKRSMRNVIVMLIDAEIERMDAENG